MFAYVVVSFFLADSMKCSLRRLLKHLRFSTAARREIKSVLIKSKILTMKLTQLVCRVSIGKRCQTLKITPTNPYIKMKIVCRKVCRLLLVDFNTIILKKKKKNRLPAKSFMLTRCWSILKTWKEAELIKNNRFLMQ